MTQKEAKIISFPFDAQLRTEAITFAACHSKNPHSDFILAHGQRPDRDQAAAIGKLLGKKVRAADGSLQPPKSKAGRTAAKKSRRIGNDEGDTDANLDRMINAIALLAQNESAPIALIQRMSTMQQDEVSENIEKALKCMIRFADRWLSHVRNGIAQSQTAASENAAAARAAQLYLVRESD
jgi:hypothetical protein